MSASENTSSDLNLSKWALVGAPNSGKTTLYNWLTHSKFKTVNYPGATVEYSIGALAPQWKSSAMVVDTPGVYSLHPKSADEVVTLKVLYSNPSVGLIHAVIVVIDGTQLSRHLLLAEQIKETGFPMVIAVTMSDLLRKQKIELDLKYLKERFSCPVVLVDGLLGGGIDSLVGEVAKISGKACGRKPDIWDLDKQEAKSLEIEAIAKKALKNDPSIKEKMAEVVSVTRRVDRFLMHPWFGMIGFIVIMTLLFSSIFWMAAPLMDFVDQAFSFLSDQVLELTDKSLFGRFLGEGLITGLGAVLVFVPQIFILFLGIGVLEGSGYLARAATIIDKPFSRLGLSGRSFVPILSGFACAVPAMIATRNIPSSRDRWITNFIIPLMTCSARLPVYALLLAFLFRDRPAWIPGLILSLLYMGSLFVGAMAAGLVNQFLPKKEATFFMMELPLYRRPRVRVILHQSVMRTLSYVKRAGPVILVLSMLIWMGSHFPHEKLNESYLGRAGQILEPVFAPMGADWRVGVGLLSAFAAREVFVSSLAIVFNIDDENEETLQTSLLSAMDSAKNSQGEALFTVASVAALIVFFMVALQCMSTVAISIRESQSWKYAMSQLVVFNLVAYILAVAIFQTLRHFPLVQ